MPTTTFLLLLLLLLLLRLRPTTTSTTPFLFQRFYEDNLTLFNSSYITSTGALCLTDITTEGQLGRAFLPSPLPLRRSPSFSTSFVFSISPESPDRSDHGMALTFTNSTLSPHLPNENLGLDPFTHFVAVELDTVRNPEYFDPDGNHVGIDVNSLNSINATSASSIGINLTSGELIQLWVDYNASTDLLSVSLARLHKPPTHLLASTINLSSFPADDIYVGFSASSGGATGSHYVLAWSFTMDGEAVQRINPDSLPEVPKTQKGARKWRQNLIFPAVIVGLALLLICGYGGAYWVRRKRRLEEFVEDEDEISYGPNRIKYMELYRATRGFKEENLVGVGGFGRVYKGTLRGRSGGGNKGCSDGQVVAVKRIAQGSSQGVREFVAEISSMARLRHRNLVQLIGYCRRREELLLVYDYMVNGSLDKFLYGSKKAEILSWAQRFHVVRGVAEGLLYLHEGWEQVVVHRDIKASNVLLDADFNGHLSDFGLAKIFDRSDGQEHTTRVVGTPGYLAPEITRTGKATTFTDVYAFGAFLLEVACGKRPMAAQNVAEGIISPQFLVDCVTGLWRAGDILRAVDPRLGHEYATAEAEVMLKLGVLCSHEVPAGRPSMRQVVQALDGDAELPVDPPELGTAAAATMVAVAYAAEGDSPVPPLDLYGREDSSLSVEPNSSLFSQ